MGAIRHRRERERERYLNSLVWHGGKLQREERGDSRQDLKIASCISRSIFLDYKLTKLTCVYIHMPRKQCVYFHI